MDNQDPSFKELYGVPHRATESEKSGLMEWYDRIYDVPFSRFSIEDLARACRQKRFPEFIVPRVLSVLREQPMSGELYEGELFDALMSVPTSFWDQSTFCRKELIDVFDQCQELLRKELEPFDFDKLHAFVQTIREM